MEVVLRALTIYLGLLVLFRLAGTRTLAQITAFDLVLLLIISEAFQSALVGEDGSLTAAFVAATTLVLTDIVLSLLKQRSKVLERLLDDVPLVLVEEGRPLRDRMNRARVDEEDVLAAARMQQGLERMEQIRYAVLERSGGISIIAKIGTRDEKERNGERAK